MSRILTGIQSTGTPHLGNLLSVIFPTIHLSHKSQNETFCFIADLHSLTQIKNINKLQKYAFDTAVTWISCGLNFENSFFYRQSDVTEVTELMWILLCYFSYSRLKLAHSFKDKSMQNCDINSGLFTYPILMAADILLYDSEYVPIGQDQLQHLEFTRDIVHRFNHQHGKIFVYPKAIIQKNVKFIPGTDGNKMSKSKNNFLNIFLPEKELYKQIFSIKTDSKSLKEPKDPNNDNLFKLFKFIGNSQQIDELYQNYLTGIGYSDVKKQLFELILEKFKIERNKFNYYQNHYKKVENILKLGAIKTKKIAKNKLKQIRSILKYNKIY